MSFSMKGGLYQCVERDGFSSPLGFMSFSIARPAWMVSPILVFVPFGVYVFLNDYHNERFFLIFQFSSPLGFMSFSIWAVYRDRVQESWFSSPLGFMSFSILPRPPSQEGSRPVFVPFGVYVFLNIILFLYIRSYYRGFRPLWGLCLSQCCVYSGGIPQMEVFVPFGVYVFLNSRT